MAIISLVGVSPPWTREYAHLSPLNPANVALPHFINQFRWRANVAHDHLARMIAGRAENHSGLRRGKRNRVHRVDASTHRFARVRDEAGWNVHRNHRRACRPSALVYG